MSVTTTFTLPRRSSTLDTTRRRGPPSPLILGAACQRKVLRSYIKYPEPNLPGVDHFVTRDSSCDRIVRGKFACHNHNRKATLDLEWLGRRISHRATSSMVSDQTIEIPSQVSQVSQDAAEIEARIKRAVIPPRTFDGIYGDSYIEVNPHLSSITVTESSHSRQSSIDSVSSSSMTNAQPITLPPLCLLD